MDRQALIERHSLVYRILLAGILLQAFFVLMHGINKELFDDGFFFSLDHDLSLPSWATCALFAVAGAACGFYAGFVQAARRPFAALAVFCLGLSMEQLVQLHVRVEESVADPGSKLIEIALGVILVLVISLAARTLSRPFRGLLLSSIAILVISALSSQMNQSLDLPYVGVIFFQTLEEVTEMLTAIVIVAAVAEPLWTAVSRRAQAGPAGAIGTR